MSLEQLIKLVQIADRISLETATPIGHTDLEGLIDIDGIKDQPLVRPLLGNLGKTQRGDIAHHGLALAPECRWVVLTDYAL